MTNYKGYNVPDVGELVSKETTNLHNDYCENIRWCDNKMQCIKCLFHHRNLTKQWHEARVKQMEVVGE